jgi:hypothetical protein
VGNSKNRARMGSPEGRMRACRSGAVRYMPRHKASDGDRTEEASCEGGTLHFLGDRTIESQQSERPLSVCCFSFIFVLKCLHNEKR